jgi:hypothetical protein
MKISIASFILLGMAAALNVDSPTNTGMDNFKALVGIADFVSPI